jgi:hypothetical protein
MRAAGMFWIPTMRSRDILLQAKWGSPWSNPPRADGTRDDQAGEAGQVERVSKLGLKGLSDCSSNEIVAKAARCEDSGPNKRANLTENLRKERAGQQL